jgi:hypothetical protein
MPCYHTSNTMHSCIHSFNHSFIRHLFESHINSIAIAIASLTSISYHQVLLSTALQSSVTQSHSHTHTLRRRKTFIVTYNAIKIWYPFTLFIPFHSFFLSLFLSTIPLFHYSTIPSHSIPTFFLSLSLLLLLFP